MLKREGGDSSFQEEEEEEEEEEEKERVGENEKKTVILIVSLFSLSSSSHPVITNLLWFIWGIHRTLPRFPRVKLSRGNKIINRRSFKVKKIMQRCERMNVRSKGKGEAKPSKERMRDGNVFTPTQHRSSADSLSFSHCWQYASVKQGINSSSGFLLEFVACRGSDLLESPDGSVIRFLPPSPFEVERHAGRKKKREGAENRIPSHRVPVVFLNPRRWSHTQDTAHLP